ncbi:integral peroxisomal membrane peroxin-domain-containing protein [Dendryphion nanum]|uniref:Integral peroxisomal membrane peroxin-domain-containing protein n=1 Tax=Dendryphion nanum TaxID=256645 RepID=A0A9P9J1R1_9PLEO|nr:integral peroxisomal membrane peroxin-domain-containing protein [Dendryphion nanum]
MSTHSRSTSDVSPQPSQDPNPPTYAAFSPSTIGQATPQTKVRSAILVHQKSPLLVATPPQITRVLAHSHPFLLPLNKFVGLLTWTTGDPWESFLLVAVFWAVVLYGDIVNRYAGPIIGVVGLILGMYARRYSPLSSTGWTGEKGQKGHKRAESESNIKHHKSLEEIVDTLKVFTYRCNILLDPFLRLTDFLSTQRTATSATTRPALTVLFIRILCVLPIWIILTLPPFYILTTRRAVLAVGTVVLSWHSRPARVSRTILWRSRMVRETCVFITGLDFGPPRPKGGVPPLPPRRKSAQEVAASLAAKRRPDSPGVRFTFTVYENQRRWLGIGWTSSMLAYERASWTDEHLNATPPKDLFELPEVEGGQARWRWVQGSEWKLESSEPGKTDKTTASDGRRGQDGWGRYTRRRKWYRDAELVEVTASTEVTPIPTPKLNPVADSATPSTPTPASKSKRPSIPDSEATTAVSPPSSNGNLGEEYTASVTSDTDAASTRSRRSWFKKKPNDRSRSRQGSGGGSDKAVTIASETSAGTERSRRSDEDDVHTPLERTARDDEWRYGDDIRMQLDL